MDEIIKILGIGLISLVIAIILKQYRPEYTIYISIIAGILILFLAMEKLSGIINLLQSISNKTYINQQFLGILLKITGIAIITEFAPASMPLQSQTSSVNTSLAEHCLTHEKGQ